MARRKPMSSRVRLLAWFCFGLALPVFAGEAQWVEVHSPHFSVVTDAGEKRGRDAAVRFEQMRAVFGTLMTQAKVNTPVPLQIVAFRNSKELRQFAPIWQGKPTEMAGLFVGGSDRCFILLDMSTEDPWQVVFHEYAHQLMNGTLSVQLDPWFEEGFAEYFRSIQVNGKEADVGRIPEDEYYVLEHGGWIKLADLFRVQQYSKTYNESGDHRNVFYAESGILVHYLYDNSLIPKAGDYFNLVRTKHVPVEGAIQQAFAMSADQFDKTVRSYARSGQFKYFKLAAPAGIDGKTYSSAPLALVNAQATLADVHLHSQDYQKQAGQEFEAVLATDPNNAAALRGLGYLHLMQHDLERAREYFHKSASLNSNDPRVLYYSALLSQRQTSETIDANTEQLKSMQSELEKSIRLDPEFADAYNILAFTYRSQGKQNEAITALRKAIDLNPRNEQYAFNLASLYLERQDFDNAMSILHTLQNSGDPQVSQRSAVELARVQQYREQIRTSTQPPTSGFADKPILTIEPASTVSGQESPSPTHAGAARFLKGTLVSVDCAKLPAATLMVLAGRTTWKMRVSNSTKAVVIGADQFSCDWKNQKVAVNYRETSEGEGDIISLEIQ